ncbi:single-stranded DNA-binding protein [Oscillospiraceae bacterium OttesenSCG-928-F05]|nr:single-stranded DNA-binding protein [Oscillospiraceae bacterium OttesenSCG-928-F05]
MLNKIILMGRLTADPELRSTQSDIPVANFTLAVERNYTNESEKRDSDFIDCVAWRNNAEFVSKWFKKGQLVAVVGSLEIRKWQDKDGNHRSKAEVVLSERYFAERKRESGDAANGASAFPGGDASAGFEEPGLMSDDDELPF